jgi:hypothetical protein
LIKINPLSNLFIMQPSESIRGRLNKRLQANSPLRRSFRICSPTENGSPSPDRCRKRARKSTQLPQVRVYEDEILGADSPDSDAQNKFTPVLIESQTGKIWPYITVEIPSRSDFQSNLATTASKKEDREPLSSLLSTAINGARKAP